MLTLNVDQVIETHDFVIQKTGGLLGLSKDISLESVLNRISNEILYNDLRDPIEVAAWYGYAIARGHAFIDGNKRTALMCMDAYLELVNITLNLQPTPKELADLMEKVAEGLMTHHVLSAWLRTRQVELNTSNI